MISAKKTIMQVVIWTQVILMIAPPALMAQGLGGLPGQQSTEPQTQQRQQIFPPLGIGPQMGGQQIFPPLEQPIIMNPTALQPLSPLQVPCPPQPIERPQLAVQQGMGPIPPTQTFQVQQSGSQVGPGQQNIPPGGAGQQPVQQVGLGQQLFPQAIQGQTFTSPFSLQGGTELQYGPGPLSPFSSPGEAGQQLGFQVGPGQQGIPQRDELSIEEGFSRFSVLQGITYRLKQFGYNFFDFPVSTFAPVMDVPVGRAYVIGPDDTLSISIWNVPDVKFNKTYIVPVGRDGTIFVPNVGTIPLAGQTFSEANRLIMARLGNLLKRFEAHVSMARLRTIKVYVVGEVVRPGAYELSSLAAASNAIYAACGPSNSGSLRQIRVVREAKVVAELDFYDFLLKGDRSKDVRLHSGDAILIPPIAKVAAIGGPVRRPAIYELTGKTTLAELIELAGGLAPTADRRSCHIFRIQAGQNRVILDVDLEKAQAERNKNANEGIGADPLI